MKLSDTQSLVLSTASQHPQRLATAPKTLPAAARNAVFRSMLKNGLLAECAAPREHAGLAWREDADGARIALRITDTGLRAIGVDPGEEGDAATNAQPDESSDATEAGAPERPSDAGQAGSPPAPTPRATLREAAQAVLDAWDDDADRGALAGPMERLRAMLAKRSPAARDAGAPGKPREGTKQGMVLAMLRRPEGATVAQIAEATGWAPHTVRGFFAGLKKKAIEVAVLERVRRVGPNKEGAKGSYTVYQVAH
jgi:Protein of unknown function (DUF3489)